MEEIKTVGQGNGDEVNERSVRQMREFLRNTITDEIKRECPGVMIITLTTNEYETLNRLLSESSERRIRERISKGDKGNKKGMTLNVIMESGGVNRM